MMKVQIDDVFIKASIDSSDSEHIIIKEVFDASNSLVKVYMFKLDHELKEYIIDEKYILDTFIRVEPEHTIYAITHMILKKILDHGEYTAEDQIDMMRYMLNDDSSRKSIIKFLKFLKS
jgi:hypothetical protein